MNTATKQRIPNKVIRRKKRREERAAIRERGEVIARARFVKIAPRKARLVVDAIRGKSTAEALDILKFLEKRAARVIEKIVSAAIANAENNFMLDADKLYIYRANVDNGPTMRRFKARAMGRAAPIRRKTSHVTIVVMERGEKK